MKRAQLLVAGLFRAFHGFPKLFQLEFACSVKWHLQRQQVCGLLEEEESKEETCSSWSCDFTESLSEPSAGASGAGAPFLPTAIEQWELRQIDFALHPSRFELHTFTPVLC